MKVLEGIDSGLFVAIDIETVRLNHEYDDLPERYQSAWEYKNKNDGQIPEHEVLCDIWARQASLYAEFSKVCAVSIAFLDKTGEKLMCKNFAGTDEATILIELQEWLDRISKGKPGYRLVGHASKYFDYPFLGKRYMINGMKIPKMLDSSHLKPWEGLNQDTNTLWKLGGTGPGSSLQALCTVFNIPVSKVDMVGDQVGIEYEKGNIEGIAKYCAYDTIATFNVIRRFKFEPIFQFEDVIYLDDVDTAPVSDIPVLELLFKTKEFTDEVKAGIKEKIFAQKVLKKEWPMLELMVRDCYIENAMFKADPKKVATAKTEEVAEFFTQLKEEYDGKK